MGEGKERCGGCEEVWRNVWESVWSEFGGCGKVCWGVGEIGKDVGVHDNLTRTNLTRRRRDARTI